MYRSAASRVCTCKALLNVDNQNTDIVYFMFSKPVIITFSTKNGEKGKTQYFLPCMEEKRNHALYISFVFLSPWCSAILSQIIFIG